MIIDFLKTVTKKEDLEIALNVLKEFKECESEDEWLLIDFEAWAKLEQLMEFLGYLVDGEELEEDTLRNLNWVEEKSNNGA